MPISLPSTHHLIQSSLEARCALKHLQRLRDHGYEAYWVGGCVRDLLLNLTPKDYDIATNATPDQVENLFPHTIPVGKQFGVILVMDSGIQTEIATFRSDGGYTDGRRPDQIRFCEAKEDALRRDFTINGIFLDPIRAEPLDWVGGLDDLKQRKIRAIGHAPTRFEEDHLRMLRAIRFAHRFNLTIDPETFEAIRAAADKIQRVSPERIRAELIRIFTPPQLSEALKLLESSGLFGFLFPEWSLPIPATVHQTMAQIEPETESLEVWTLLCRLFETEGWPALDFAPNSDTRVQARLKSRSNLECLLRYYTFPRCEMDPILEAMQLQHKIIKTDPANLLPARRLMCEKHFDLAWRVFIRTENVTPKKDIRSPGISVAQKSLTPTYSRSSLDRWKNVRNEFLNRPDWNDPLIQGRDLLKSGVQPGPKMGHILDQIRDQQLLDKIHSPAEALELASSLIASEKNNSSERQD